MLSLISRSDALSRNPLLAQVVLGVQAAHDPGSRDGIGDRMAVPRLDLTYAGNIVLAAEAGDADTAIERCAAGLCGLAATLAWADVTFIGDFKVPLAPSNSGRSAGARRRLAALGIDGAYDGAVVASGDAMSAITRDLLTIARYEGAAPDIRFHGHGATSVGSLCKRCNLHLDVYAMDELARILASVDDAGLTVPLGGCLERFGDAGRIEGRRIDV